MLCGASLANAQLVGSSPQALAFVYQIGGPSPALMTADGGSWLSVAPDITVTPGTLTVSVNPNGMKPGLYYGLIALNDPAGDIPITFVPVSLQVSEGPILSIPYQSLVFNTQTGLGMIQPQAVTVNSAGPPAQFHVTTYGGNWLSASPVDGITSATVNVSVNASGMPAGYYLGGLSISINGVPNSQQLVPVY